MGIIICHNCSAHNDENMRFVILLLFPLGNILNKCCLLLIWRNTNISYKAMMGKYIIYYRGKIVGGIYDDRFFVKNVKVATELMPDASLELPYEGAKEMLLVDDIDNKVF